MKEEGLVERIEQLMNFEGYHSRREFATKIGFDVSNFSQVMKGNRNVPRSLLNKIVEAYPEVDKMWLYEGEGVLRIHADDIPGFGNNEQRKILKPRLPIMAAAGTLSDYLGGVKAEECEQLPVIRGVPDYDFTMIVKGRSMIPKYEEMDEIACRKVTGYIKWGEDYVLATREGAVLKRLYKDENGIKCVSYNKEEYHDFVVAENDILDVYEVVGQLRV